MMLRFYRNDGSTTPATAEHVELRDDGTFTGWRSVAPAVGWFQGTLDAAEVAGTRAAIAALGTITPSPPPPGWTVETLELPDLDPLVVTGVTDGGALGVLITRARRLLDEMVGSARAAIAVEQGAPARLVHTGTDPVLLDLSSVTMHAQYWRGYYESAGDGTELLSGSDRVRADPGWSLTLPTLAPPDVPDLTTHLTVDFAIVAGKNVVPVRAQSLPDIAQPT